MEKRKLNTNWKKNSWKNYKLLQQPIWPDKAHYESIINILNEYPSLIFPDQINQLKYRLAQVHDGKAFLIQGGECAESFNEFSEESIKNKLWPLGNDIEFIPGHGPNSTFAQERATNAFVADSILLNH